MENKNGKEVKNRLTGRSPLRRRRSAMDHTVIKKEVEEGLEEVEEEEATKGRGGEGKVATNSTHHTSVMQELIGARKIQRNSAHYLKISHEFLNMQHNFYIDKSACTNGMHIHTKCSYQYSNQTHELLAYLLILP
jgi:hypothetical protein